MRGVSYETGKRPKVTKLIGYARTVPALLHSSPDTNELTPMDERSAHDRFQPATSSTADLPIDNGGLKAGEQLARWYERRSATVFTG